MIAEQGLKNNAAPAVARVYRERTCAPRRPRGQRSLECKRLGGGADRVADGTGLIADRSDTAPDYRADTCDLPITGIWELGAYSSPASPRPSRQ